MNEFPLPPFILAIEQVSPDPPGDSDGALCVTGLLNHIAQLSRIIGPSQSLQMLKVH